MSWIVQSLLSNRNVIKAVGDINRDDYNDLLRIEMAVEKLKKLDSMSEEDLRVIDIMTGDIPGLNKLPKHSKESIYKKFDVVCERIAYYLGGYFTDEGYLNYMQRKYRLNEEQIDTMRKYMKSVYRRKIIRKGSTNESENDN